MSIILWYYLRKHFGNYSKVFRPYRDSKKPACSISYNNNFKSNLGPSIRTKLFLVLRAEMNIFNWLTAISWNMAASANLPDSWIIFFKYFPVHWLHIWRLFPWQNRVLLKVIKTYRWRLRTFLLNHKNLYVYSSVIT